MEQATNKQISYLLVLNKDLKESELKELSKIEASKLIRKLLKAGKAEENQTPQETGACDFSKIDFEQLYKKYNAYTYDTTKSNYNDINGANCKSPLLRDSRAFKKYISDIIKKEFKGVKFKISCSFAGYNEHADIILYFKDPFLQYKDMHAFSYLDDFCKSMYNNINYTYKKYDEKYIYNNYFKIRGLTETAWERSTGMYNCLKPEIKKIYDFLKDLLNSFSYDHSDIMTDYFSTGLGGHVSVYDSNITEEERGAAWDKCKNATLEERMEKGEATEEEKQEQERRHAELLKKIEEETKAREEEQKKREEQEKAYILEKESLMDDPNSYEVQTVAEDSMIIEHARFSSWNKPCSFDEACEFIEKHPESAEVGTVANVYKIVNFKNEKLFNMFLDGTMEAWEFLNGGGCCWAKKIKNKYEPVSNEKEHDLYYSKKSETQLAQAGYYWMRGAILIKFKNKNMFLVDPSGFNYCRYIGLLPANNQQGE